MPKWWKSVVQNLTTEPCASYYYWRFCCVLSGCASCSDKDIEIRNSETTYGLLELEFRLTVYFWHGLNRVCRALRSTTPPLLAPLPLHRFFAHPLTAPLPLTQFSARFAPFSAPIPLRSHALATTLRLGSGTNRNHCVACVTFGNKRKTILHIRVLKFLIRLTTSSFKILGLSYINSLRPSVKRRYCVKTTKRRMMASSPLSSPLIQGSSINIFAKDHQ